MVALLLVFLLSATQVLGGIIFHIPPGEEVCFGEELGFDMVVHGVYKVTTANGAKLKVEVHQTQLTEDGTVDVANNNRARIVSKEGNEGSFGFTTEKQGEYKFCFQALQANGDVEVDFELKVGFEARDYTEVAKKEHLKPIEVELVKLNDEATEILQELTTIRGRESAHKETTDNTNFAVAVWSGVSLTVIVVLGLYEIYYLRAYFKKKRLI